MVVDELLLVPVVVFSMDELMTEVVATAAEMIEALERGKKISDDDEEEVVVGEEANEGADVGQTSGGGGTLLLDDSKVSLGDRSDIR